VGKNIGDTTYRLLPQKSFKGKKYEEQYKRDVPLKLL